VACRASGMGSILGDGFPRLGVLIAAFHLWQDHSCFGIYDPAMNPRVKFSGSWVHNPFFFLPGRRGRLSRGRQRPGGYGLISRRCGGRGGRRITLGRHGWKGLGKNHGFPVSEQKNEDRYDGQPYFHNHFPIPAFHHPGFHIQRGKALFRKFLSGRG
jgi:hypothetical protein